jgi:FkbM family methyltransferase
VHRKLVILGALERVAAGARRVGLGSIVDRLAPRVARPFERFVLDVDGVRLGGANLAQIHYVRELVEHGRERTLVRLLTEAIPDGGTVLEGGAHLGYVTIHAAKAVGPSGRVIAFEPNPDVQPVLLENLAANGVAGRVVLVPKALGAATTKARFYPSDDVSSLLDLAYETEPVEVEVVRAEEEVKAPVAVVKLDIEGGELAALQGMQRLLAGPDAPGALFVECFPRLLEAAGSSRDELVALLEGHGYLVEWIDEEAGDVAPLSKPWTDEYVNLRCTRRA